MTLGNWNGLIYFKIFLTSCILMLLLQCENSTHKSELDLNKSKHFNQLFQEQILSFEERLINLKKYVIQDEISEVDNAFNKAFLSFKTFAFILEYFDHSLYNLFNGAPVFKEDVSSPGANLINPTGLQIIYELVANSNQNKEEIISQIDFLLHQLKYVQSISEGNIISSKVIYNAVAQNLVRFETLTLAGFDNPDLINEFEFLSAELNAMNLYLSLIDNSKEALQIKYDSTLVIDKLHFLKHDLYPFKQNLSFYTDSISNVSPIKNYASNIYNSDFINATFYSSNGILNTPDVAKIELGKMLFSDPILSSESVSFSCATCHQPDKFFTDGLALSMSNQKGTTLKRNTPTLIHSAFQSAYMYDGRAESLEDQMLHVFKNESEFKTSITEVISKLKEQVRYTELFQLNYSELESKAISQYSITDALASYVRSLDGTQSTFDKYMRSEIDLIPTNVANGFNLFMGKAKCGTCHFAPTFSGLIPPLFQDSEFENIGVPKISENNVSQIDDDLGRYYFYPNNEFKHFFKTSTVRNVEHTAPYMHNGVFSTLEEVMEFYNEGGGISHGLNYQNQTLPTEKLDLSTEEINEIIAFMKSLTDKRYLEY